MRLISSNRAMGLLGLVMGAFLMTGCSSFQQTNQTAAPQQAADASAAPAPAPANDPIRTGDKIKIELTGTPTPIYPIEQTIKEDGTVTLTHIGSVPAAGKTPQQLEVDIQKAYVPDFYKQLTVFVTPQERFFFVGGQVNRPAQQPYAGAMTVSKAIQAAGDFTDFADRKKIQITHVDKKVEFANYDTIQKHPELDLPIYPGDIIFVGKRW